MLAFVMIPMLQRELEDFRTVWNTHRIRAQKDTYMADGVPNHIFQFPERYGLKACGWQFSVFSTEMLLLLPTQQGLLG